MDVIQLLARNRLNVAEIAYMIGMGTTLFQ